MTEIAFSRNFAYTGKGMFKGCEKLEHVYGPESGYDEDKNVIYAPLSFKTVGDEMCSGCKKLKTFKLSNTTTYIGDKAFNGCESLEDFTIPSTSNLEIVYTTERSPFMNCPNITFNGTTYNVNSSVKCQVKDGAVYEVTKDRVSLIHLGKNTKISDIVSDREIYACAYSMEHHVEDDVVIPENIVFNGYYILSNSKGNSIKLKCLTNLVTKYLFVGSNYGNNYTFADNETMIPQYAFDGVSSINDYNVQEGIELIDSYAFNSVSNLRKITFPSTLKRIGTNCMWLCNSLKTMIFNSLTPPSIFDNDLFNVMLDEIIVKPEAYENFINNFVSTSSDTNKPIKLLTPFVRVSHLFNEGYVRIIKDGEYLIPNDENIVKVGGLSIIQENDLLKYTTDKIINDLDITLNGEVIGRVEGMYTTLYIGDNSKLFLGNGYNFTKGVYEENVLDIIQNNGWYYDKRFKGIRSAKESPSSITIDVTLLNNDFDIPITLGQYSQSNFKWGSIVDDKGVELFNLRNSNGYEVKKNINVGVNNITIKYVNNSNNSIKTGIDGIIVNSIGNKIYSDPLYTMDNARIVKMKCICDQIIPTDTLIEVWDDKGREYRKFYMGDIVEFILPIGDFNFISHGFVTPEGKVFSEVKGTISSNVEGVYEVIYETVTGFEENNGILCLRLSDKDYYVNLSYGESVWGNNFIDDSISVNDVISSSKDGYQNTNTVLLKDENNIMFNNARNFVFEDSTIKGYIPSYEELLIVSQNTGYNFDVCWTSDVYGEDKAWANDGKSYDRNIILKYYIFGKKIKY